LLLFHSADVTTQISKTDPCIAVISTKMFFGNCYRTDSFMTQGEKDNSQNKVRRLKITELRTRVIYEKNLLKRYYQGNVVFCQTLVILGIVSIFTGVR